MAAPSKIYARALFELTEEKNQTITVLAELRELNQSFSANAQVFAALAQGLVDAQMRVRVVTEAVRASGASSITQKFVLLLADRARLSELAEVANEVERLLNQKAGIVVGDLRSAVELSSEETKSLSGSIGKRLGVKVELRQHIEPTLLGGFVVNVAGRTFDGSLRTQLEKLKTQLSQ